MLCNQMNPLNKVFSRNTLQHLIEYNHDISYISAIRRYIDRPDGKKNVELISEIYSELKDNYRNEYYYKNTLLNKLLLGIHSINTTTALTEIPVAKSKADFVLINGKAVVYEIKTGLDNIERLENQIYDYYKAFNHVAVVTCKEHLNIIIKKIDEINKPVGIYVLQKRGTLSTIRIPEEYDDYLDAGILFELLRKGEYENILKKYFESLPAVNEFKYYSECRKMFLEIPLEQSYIEVIKQLKKRNKIVKDEFVKIPYELKFLAYFMQFSNADYSKLNEFLYQLYEEEKDVFSISKRKAI